MGKIVDINKLKKYRELEIKRHIERKIMEFNLVKLIISVKVNFSTHRTL